MKNKIFAIGGAILAVVLVLIMIITMLPTQPTNKPVDNPIVSTTVSTTTVNLEDIKEPDANTSSTTAGNFIEPNESEADKILKENTKKEETTTSKKETTSSQKQPATSKYEGTDTIQEEPKSFEDSKKELENTAKDYLKSNNIDPKTAGETGEVCAHCGKKIWNPDKYGLCIPGMPNDYENSGYCLGTCGITFG